jgi:hypothetical protein
MSAEGSIHLDFSSKSVNTLFILTIQDDPIDYEGVIVISEALKANRPLTSLDLSCNRLVAYLFSLNTGNYIGEHGAIQLAEALKSNTTLTSLHLISNNTVSWFILTRYSV